MSAIALPLVHFTDSTNANKFVPVEQVKNIEARDIAAIGNDPAKYQIVISYFHVPETTVLDFALEAKRDGAITAFKTAASTAITSA